MSERKINLDNIFNNHFDCYTNFENEGNYNDEPAISKDKFKELCLEFGKQLLELAAENAILLDNGQPLNSSRYIIEKDDSFHCEVEIDIDKQSIIDTIKQIE